MRFVTPKTPEHQDIQLMHRVAERLIAQRTALSNQTRGLLAEYGLSLPLGRATLRKSILTIKYDCIRISGLYYLY
jgi:transposase